jgi:hypothetical protein
VLEGERSAVVETFERISRDPRHQNVVMLPTEAIAARQSPQWSMAYIGPSQSAADAVERVTRDVQRSQAGEAARAFVGSMCDLLEACPGTGSSSPQPLVGERLNLRRWRRR